MKMIGWLLGFLGASFAAAALGGFATSRSVATWYRTLRKPCWNPPDWVFGPVWTALYVAMGVSAWLVRVGMGQERRQTGMGVAALAVWAVQLVLNVLWSVVFFGRRSVGGGLAVIVPLWAAIGATALLSARVAKRAGALLLPYFAWTSFATALNYKVWQLNRGR